ncbi:hypothetical protein QR721_04810 [Aciduricibacillus chroicocephali]|uniref:Lipoprotein n=1 Tax=Aciduricibacillus chroicocephali TaxID=3054939 RepID=A0ABY9KY18_9BACI|nr:hypothetical protein QR721_04810 [Bacillaceae bacterium 44XB]
MKKWLLCIALTGAILNGCSDKENATEPDDAAEQDTVVKPQTEELVPTGFKDIQFNKDQENIYVKGEAKAENGIFYYKVETQEGKELLPEKEIKLAHSHAYLPYKLKLDRNKLNADKVVILRMYSKNDKGKPTDQNYFPIEQDKIELKKQ